jgi:hypothetical protein
MWLELNLPLVHKFPGGADNRNWRPGATRSSQPCARATLLPEHIEKTTFRDDSQSDNGKLSSVFIY